MNVIFRIRMSLLRVLCLVCGVLMMILDVLELALYEVPLIASDIDVEGMMDDGMVMRKGE